MKEIKQYESRDGKVVIAYKGISDPWRLGCPFYDGYWLLLDENGSKIFVIRKDFEEEYQEVKPE